MAIIRQHHKDTDTTYVYESESYWDPEKKQSRSRRKVIGKVDPETGEIIPTGRRGRPGKRKEEQADPQAAIRDAAASEQLQMQIKEKDILIRQQQEIIRELTEQNRKLRGLLSKINALLEQADLMTDN